MALNDSNKMPYLLAAGAIGGAVGFLFFTEKGKSFRDSVFNMETTSAIPDKIEEFRGFIEKRGNDVSNRVRTVFDRLKSSLDEGKRAYERGGANFQTRMDTLSRTHTEVTSNIHRAIDNLGKTIQTVEHSLLEPIYEAGSVVQGFEKGVRHLVSGSENEQSQETSTADFYRDQQRRMG